MAFVDTPLSKSAATSPVSGLIAKFRLWSEVRATRELLNDLTERQLADIGLARVDIDTFR